MLGSVATSPKALADYRPIIGDEKYEEILALGRALKGARVLHVNATAFGGGVAEILATMVPLMNDIGMVADWQVIRGADEFFQVTKAMHNSLQGMYIDWTQQMWDIWCQYNRLNAELFDQEYDFVIIHDPQPAAVLSFIRNEGVGVDGGHWIWRCHIDLTAAQEQVWDILRQHVSCYDAAIFTLASYVRDDLTGPRIFAIPVSIDPLSPKNMDLAPEAVTAILQRYGVDASRPIISQISRFDPWKDPLGVIDVYRMVKDDISDLQLVLIASMAHDDPEGWSWYERTVRRAGEDYDIHILSNLNGVGNVEVNAFQRASRVVIQKSIREGFGLVVSEALWKGRPVVATNVGGIPLQIQDGRSGFLVNSTSEAADRVRFLLRHPDIAAEMGRAGHEHVREHFLATRHLRDYLAVFLRLQGVETAPALQEVRTGAGGGPK